MEVCSHRPPGVDITAELQFCLSALQMTVVSEDQHFSLATLTQHHVRQIIRHQRVSHAEKSDNPFARLSCQGGVIVQ